MLVFCELLPFWPSLSGSTLPPPLRCVKKYTVYTYHYVRGGGYGVLGLRQINTCRKSFYRSIFIMTKKTTFCIAFFESYLSKFYSKTVRLLSLVHIPGQIWLVAHQINFFRWRHLALVSIYLISPWLTVILYQNCVPGRHTWPDLTCCPRGCRASLTNSCSWPASPGPVPRVLIANIYKMAK